MSRNMKSSDDDKIKATLLYHLRRKKVLGGVHAPFDTLTEGFPSHEKGDVKKIAKNLIKQGVLTTKPASYGLQVSLNNKRLPEIEALIKRVLGLEV